MCRIALALFLFINLFLYLLVVVWNRDDPMWQSPTWISMGWLLVSPGRWHLGHQYKWLLDWGSRICLFLKLEYVWSIQALTSKQCLSVISPCLSKSPPKSDAPPYDKFECWAYHYLGLRPCLSCVPICFQTFVFLGYLPWLLVWGSP